MKKVLFIFAMLFLVIGLTACQSPQAESDGSITLIVLDIDGNELENEVVDFYEGDTFLEVLESSVIDFQFTDDATYGAWLSGIGSYTLPTNGYWSIYENGEYATVGVSDQDIVDGDVFTFQMATF